jgi:hypothetical protein
VIASIFIVNTAGMVTLSILEQMIYVDENGDEHAPSPFFIFVLLFVVLVVETIFFIFVIRFLKRAYAKYRKSNSEQQVDSRVDSSSDDGSNGGPTRKNSGYFPTTFLNLSTFLRSQSNSAAPANGYVPLPSMDESSHGTQTKVAVSEMVQYTPLQSSARQVQQPLLQNAYIVTNLPSTAHCITPVAIL